MGVVVKALLESGADFMIADNSGITPMAIAKQEPPRGHRSRVSTEARRECVAALEVRPSLLIFTDRIRLAR
jgi:hypothetical protein